MRFTGMTTLPLSTNFVIAAKHSNVVAVASSIGTSVITVTNSVEQTVATTELTITNSANLLNEAVVVGTQSTPVKTGYGIPGAIPYHATAKNLATNIYRYFVANPVSGVSALGVADAVVTFAASPYGTAPTVTVPEDAGSTGESTTDAYVDTGVDVGDGLTNNASFRLFADSMTPTTIKASTDNNVVATNIYLAYTLYPQYGLTVTMTESNAVKFTATPYGASVASAGEWCEVVNATTAYTKPAYIDTTKTDNLTLQLYAQGSAASTDKIIFQFAGGDGTNWDSTLISSSVTLSGPTLVYAVTNLGVVNWPFLKLVTVTNVSAVNLTNFGVRYGYKY